MLKTRQPPANGLVGDSHGVRSGVGFGVCEHVEDINIHNYRAHFDRETLNYVTEDTRLSTLQRRLVRETNVRVALCLAFQIRECILTHENRSYVKRASDIILEAILEVLAGKHANNVKVESAKAIGSVGFVLTDLGDFDRFYNWLWKKFEGTSKEALQTFYLKGLAAYVDTRPPQLNDEQIAKIMDDIQNTLEATNDSGIMLALMDALSIISKWRPILFEPAFQDVVDILVGWHIDSFQSPMVRSSVSKVLLSWHAYWIIDMEFSSRLLGQFMEDFSDHFAEVKASNDPQELEELGNKILSLIQVLNTVLSCLKTRNAVSFLPPESSEWCEIILDCLSLTLEKVMNEDLLISGQHAFVMLLERIGTLFQQHHLQFMAFIDLNLELFEDISFHGQISVMEFLSRMYNLADGDHQPQIAAKATDIPSPIFDVITHGQEHLVRLAVAGFYKSLLMSKNIHTLQNVYGHLNCLHEKALTSLSPTIPKFMPKNKFQDLDMPLETWKNVISFVLTAYTNLAVAKGSVLSIWALDPPIFRLLLQHCGLDNPDLKSKYPWVHVAILKLLHAHCSKHGLFLSSSDLVVVHSSHPTPTSGYFTMMLKLLGQLLRAHPRGSTSLSLLLGWTRQVLEEVQKSQKYLLNTSEYRDFLNAILDLALVVTDQQLYLLVLVSEFHFQFVSVENLKMTSKVYQLARVNLTSANPGLVDKALEILKFVPSLLCQLEVHANPLFEQRTTTVKKKILYNRSTSSITSGTFKIFMESLLKSPFKIKKDLGAEVLRHLDFQRKDFPRVSDDVILEDLDIRGLWIGLAVAQYCVNNKLKTPLGNANATLTTIEKVIRAMNTSIAEEAQPRVVLNFHEARQLLVFFENLEKTMTNGYDGSGVFLPSPPKITINFFVANKKTCVDWLLRLRPALVDLAFHLNEMEIVVRNAHAFLHRMTELKQLSDPQITKVIVHLALALTQLGSHEELSGLYTWCSEKTDKKHYWIKSLILLAQNRVEEGTKSLITTLKRCFEGSPNDQSVFGPVTLELMKHVDPQDQQVYEKWMSDYKDKIPKDHAEVSEACLKVLGEFQDGIVAIPEPINGNLLNQRLVIAPNTVDQRLEATKLLLCQVAQFIPELGVNRGGIQESLKLARKHILGLFKDCQLSLTQERAVIILNQLHGEFESALKGEDANLDSFLAYQSDKHSVQDLITIKKWGEFLLRQRKTKNTGYNYQKLNSLTLEIAKTARKSSNLILAEKYLKKTLMGGIDTANSTIEDHLLRLDFRTSMLSIERASCLRQCAKLSFKSTNEISAVRVLSGIATRIGDMFFHDTANPELMETSSRALHNMAHWFLSNPELLDKVYPDMAFPAPDGITLINVLDLEQRAAGALDFLPMVEESSDCDIVIGRLLRLAVVQSPQLGKLWFTFAEWALGLGEKVLGSTHITILEEERQAVLEALPNATKTELDQIFTLLQQFKLGHSEKAGIETDCEEFMRKELMECEALTGHESKTLSLIYNVWLGIQKRTFFYHEIAISSFFQFIALSQSEGDQLITATLRLLRLTVRHALELQESLQAGLERTPCSKWKAIIPQLFSRLNHPVRIVRTRISELLCRIAQDFSHLIIYPAVVGADNSSTSGLSRILTSNVSDNEDSDDEDIPKIINEIPVDVNPLMQGAFAQILEIMLKQNAKSVGEIRDFVAELQRISLLWDELWFGTLHQHSNDIARRIRKMETEVDKLNKNHSLSEEEKLALASKKYSIIFKPILYVLDKAWIMTDRSPETPHEKFFTDNFAPGLKEIIGMLRHPTDVTRPKIVWDRLSKIQAQLRHRISAKPTLKLSAISPNLAELKNSQIPMPGMTTKHDIMINRMDESLLLLLTKTKPKKLSLVGSDGKVYPYLFKGLEDLHLDERIMQFLSIANIMMKKKDDKAPYKARHYSVVPLGPRSGLIQWVRDANPMYLLFKKWQLRQQLAYNEKKLQDKKLIAYQKPSEFYYNKLYPLLKEYGVSVDNRKSWPSAMMKKLLHEMMADTPDNIIAQELWFASVDSRHWFNTTQNMTRSIAVTSVIGYIIGLGDRHMENLMVDVNRGEVIHIDYNICFEKGKQLKIPEKVPCRLTQNIIKIFGITGVDGLFRRSCEHTLEALRKGKDTLLTLLEAFIYDPLVDWTPEVLELGLAGTYQGGRPLDMDMEDKRNMKSEITFSMLAVRVAEIKTPWLDNQSTLQNSLGKVDDQFSSWFEISETIEGLNEYHTGLHHAIAALKEAEANTDHRLFALFDNYVEQNLMKKAIQNAKAKVSASMEEYQHWNTLHTHALSSMTSKNISDWSERIASLEIKPKQSSGLVKGFLENAGQSPLFVQFSDVEALFCAELYELKQSALTTVQLLAHYYTISNYLPLSAKQEHRWHLFRQWAGQMLDDFSFQTSSDIIRDFTEKFVELNPKHGLKQHHVIKVNYQLETWGHKMHFQVQQILQKMVQAQIESSPNALEALNEIKSDLQEVLEPETDDNRQHFEDRAFQKMAPLCQKIVTLEMFAKAQTQGFLDTPSSKGEWLLQDEIFLNIGHMGELLDSMNFLGLSKVSPDMVDAVSKISRMILRLMGLNSSFSNIILHEGIKGFLKEDSSATDMSLLLNSMVADTDTSLEGLIHELDEIIVSQEQNTPCPPTSNQTLDQIKSLKESYDKVAETVYKVDCHDRLPSGQLIFLAFNTLFNDIYAPLNALKDQIRAIPIPSEWSKIQEIKQSRGMTTYLEDPVLADLNDLSVFLHKWICIQDFFGLCTKTLLCFKADPKVYGLPLPTGEELIRPMKIYLAEFYRKEVIGLASRTISAVLCHSQPSSMSQLGKEPIGITDLSLQDAHPKVGRAPVWAQKMAKLCDSSWKLQVVKALEHQINLLNAMQQLNIAQRNSFQWIYEAEITGNPEPRAQVMPIRANFMIELQNHVSKMVLLKKRMDTHEARFNELYETVEQRLKWASGANPDLQAVFNGFATSRMEEIDALKTLRVVMRSISNVASTILHYEALRTPTPEAMTADGNFMSLMGECQQSAALKESHVQTLSAIELRLFELCPPEEFINLQWIQKAEGIVAELVNKSKGDIKAELAKMKEVTKNLKEGGKTIRSEIIHHQKIFSDAGTLLRSISKSEDYDIPIINDYLNRYREFSEQVSLLVNGLASDEQTLESARILLGHIERIKEIIHHIYRELLGIGAIMSNDKLDEFKIRKDDKGEDADNEDQEKKTSSEEKNTFAMNVLRRVRIKLDGREPDALKMASVPEQVDFIIREATNVDNLALMYEGWTAWI